MAEFTRFIEHYEARIALGELTPDAAQLQAAYAFDALYKALRDKNDDTRKSVLSMLKNWISPAAPDAANPAQGLYLWGDVGRGKSMLMDLFVEALSPYMPTRRQHFHAFMQEVHQHLFGFRRLRVADPLPRVVDHIANTCRVLCLDEMQVHDVADAMILSRLFEGLMDAGISVVFTSNRPPSDLYQGGLQREQFVRFIDMLEVRIPIIQLGGALDYRMEQERAVQCHYMFPRNLAADEFLLASWARLTGSAPSQRLEIDVNGRKLRVDKFAKGVAWLTFAELCIRPLGAADYLALIAQCHTLLLQGIPALKKEDRNEAKRFVTLIDTIYDHRVKLVATAETPPEGIYGAGDGSFEFARTVSRLNEMQSDDYWALAKIG